jgi:hypothetical protein
MMSWNKNRWCEKFLNLPSRTLDQPGSSTRSSAGEQQQHTAACELISFAQVSYLLILFILWCVCVLSSSSLKPDKDLHSVILVFSRLFQHHSKKGWPIIAPFLCQWKSSKVFIIVPCKLMKERNCTRKYMHKASHTVLGNDSSPFIGRFTAQFGDT